MPHHHHHHHTNQQPWPSWLWSSKNRQEPSSDALDQERYLGLQGPLGHPSRCCQAHCDHGCDQCRHGSCSVEKIDCILNVDVGDLHPSRHQCRLNMEKEIGEEENGDNEETHLSTRPSPSTPHQRNAPKGLRGLLRLVNIVCISLILLCCIAVSNLLSTPTRPGVTATGRCLKDTSSDSTSMSASYSSMSSSKDDHSQEFLQQSYDSEQDQALSKPSPGSPKPPAPAKRKPQPLSLHNDTLIDSYRWMHRIEQDPDVKAYIKVESEYTASWIHHSGIANLQKQLQNEMAQIKDAITRLPLITGGEHNKSERPDERLEGTKFWDLDRWRYWLDESVGTYGVYKRRFLPRNSYDMTTENVAEQDSMGSSSTTRSQFIFSPPAIELDVEDTPLRAGQGCSAEPVALSTVQVVLDVNRLTEMPKDGGAKQFAMGSVEIQPKSTFLVRDTNKGTYVAYTYDVSGGERFAIRILLLPEDKPQSESDHASPSLECGSSCEQVSQGRLLSFEGVVVKDAGLATRWAKLGGSLYLYFTILDQKGLPREVWRVKVDDVNNDGGEESYEPELVMHEDDEGKELSISTTSDDRFLLIESSGQATSCTYFSNVDSLEQGWNLIRPAEKNVQYKVEHHSGYFYLLTNQGNSPNFRVLRVPVRSLPRHCDTTLTGVPTTSPDNDDCSFPSNMEEEIVIEHDPAEYVQRFSVFARHFVAWIWRDGLQEIRIYSAPQPGSKVVKLPLTEVQRVRPYNEDVKVTAVMPFNARDPEDRLFVDFYSAKLWYSNSSYVRPWAIYEVDMDLLTPATVEWRQGGKDGDERLRDATSLICQDPFPLGVQYGRSSYQTYPDEVEPTHTGGSREEQEQAIAKFEEQLIMVPSRQREIWIPVTLAYYAFSDGPQFPRRTAFVKVFGAYGAMTVPKFEPEMILPLLHRGIVYVHIHPRGDGNLGPAWHDNGKAENKMNTFYDVEDVLLYLRDSGMVEKEGVVLKGQSGGGVVSGWIANRWGEEFIPSPAPPGSRIRDSSLHNGDGSKNFVREMVKAVLCQVPFVDVIGDLTDPKIPWAENEQVEWGSPLKSHEVYKVMKKYSPYDRVRNRQYPAMLVTGGLADLRVNYAQPLKFVAKLRGIDGKTNDCQSIRDEVSEGTAESGNLDDTLLTTTTTKTKKMCAGKEDTPLLLQMEDGGHFAEDTSLWMAFGLYQLSAENVVSTTTCLL